MALGMVRFHAYPMRYVSSLDWSSTMLTAYVMMNTDDDVIGIVRIDTTETSIWDTKWILRSVEDYRNMMFDKHCCRLQNDRVKVIDTLTEINGRTPTALAMPLINYLQSAAGIQDYVLQGRHAGLAEYDYECHKWGI